MYLGKFKRIVKRNQMNSRRLKTIAKHEKLESIYEIYKNLSLEEQISEAVNTAYQIGTLDKLQIQYSFIEGPDNFSDSDSD